MGGGDVTIVSAGSIQADLSTEHWASVSLYSQPWFLQTVAPRKGWYARIASPENPLVVSYFPFCGYRILWKWRLFQPAFCQRFQPFSPSGIVDEASWRLWFRFLESRVWRGHWPFVRSAHLPDLQSLSPRIEERTNYIFPISEDVSEMLGRWKAKSRGSVKKASFLNVSRLDASDFESLAQKLAADNVRHWRPNKNELHVLNSILRSTAAEAYGVFHDHQALALSLMVDWGGRFHYLLGVSTQAGREKEAMSLFFKAFLEMKAGSGKILDFEGSSIPGIAAFFRSMGGEPEKYLLWQK